MLTSTPECEHRTVGMRSAVAVEQTPQVSTHHASAAPGHVGNAFFYAHAFQLPGKAQAGEGEHVEPPGLMLRYSGPVRDVPEPARQGQQLWQQDLLVFRDEKVYSLSLVNPAVRRYTS